MSTNDPQSVTGREPGLTQPSSNTSSDVQLGGDAAVLHLVSLLDSDDPGTRFTALLALSDMGDARAFDHLIAIFTTDAASLSLHSRSAEALAKLGDPRAFEPMLEFVAARESGDVLPYRVVRAIYTLDRERTWRTFEAWASDADNLRRQSAVEALGFLDPVRAEPILIQSLADSVLEVRRSAVELLEKHATSQAIAALLNVLRDPVPVIRACASRALARLKDPASVEQLLEMVIEGDPHADTYAMHALVAIPDERIIPRLMAALREASQDWGNYNRAVIRALGELKVQEAVPLLIDFIDNTHAGRWISEAGIEALARLDPDAAFERLKPLLSDPDDEVRNDALNLLHWVRTEEAVEAIIDAALNDPDNEMIQGTVSVVFMAPPGDEHFQPWPLGPMLQRLGDPDPEVRSYAASELVCMVSSQDVDAVAEMLNHSDPMVRRCACQALKEIKSPDGIPFLMNVLSDPDDYVRRIAAYALGELRDPQACHALIAVLQDVDVEARCKAARALGYLRCKEAASHLIRSLADRAWREDDEHHTPVSDYAAFALEDINTPEALAAVQSYYAERGPNHLYRIEIQDGSIILG